MLVRQVCVALAIAALSGAVPAPVKHVLHEKRSEHVDWVKGERIKRDSVLPVRIGLTQNNLEKGDEYLMAVWVVFLCVCVCVASRYAWLLIFI